MDYLDGWATLIGDSTCRFFSERGHAGLERLFCSDGSYSAGWRLFAAAILLSVVTYFVYRMMRVGP